MMDYRLEGYLNDPETTGQLFTEDGWMRTGDMGKIDERGHLIVEGKEKKYSGKMLGNSWYMEVGNIKLLCT